MCQNQFQLCFVRCLTTYICVYIFCLPRHVTMPAPIYFRCVYCALCKVEPYLAAERRQKKKQIMLASERAFALLPYRNQHFKRISNLLARTHSWVFLSLLGFVFTFQHNAFTTCFYVNKRTCRNVQTKKKQQNCKLLYNMRKCQSNVERYALCEKNAWSNNGENMLETNMFW